MFGKNARRKLEDELATQRRSADTALNTQINKPPSALEVAKEKEQTDWLQQTNSPDFDITKTTGMAPYLNLFNRAKANDSSEDTPMPTAATWGGEANPNLAAALKSQGDRSREQEAAGGLEQGFREKNASIRGETLPFLGMQQDRSANLMNLLNNRSLGSAGLQERSMSFLPFWQRYLLNAQSSAGAMAGAGGGG